MGSELTDNNLIEKSKTLVWAKFKNYTAGELRLLEVYLSRINPRDPGSACVHFTLREYCDLLGLPEMDTRNLRPQLDHFLGNVVTINKPNSENEFIKLTLFTRAEVVFDKELDQSVIYISCNGDLKNVFFELADQGYVKYRLRYTAHMKSQYSIQLYSMLRDMLHIEGGWNMSLDKLREQLGASEKSYLDFRDLRRRVLEPAMREINELSDLNVTYSNITKGRKVTGIHFDAALKPRRKTDGDRDPSELLTEHDGRWYSNALQGIATPEKALKLARQTIRKIREVCPEVSDEQIENAAYDVLSQAYEELIVGRTNDEPIFNPTGYIWAVISAGEAVKNYLPARYLLAAQ